MASFLGKLLAILDCAKYNSIRWNDTGDSFYVHNLQFTQDVFATEFNGLMFEDIVHILASLGFIKVKVFDSIGYHHFQFKRGRPELILELLRSYGKFTESISQPRLPSLLDDLLRAGNVNDIPVLVHQPLLGPRGDLTLQDPTRQGSALGTSTPPQTPMQPSVIDMIQTKVLLSQILSGSNTNQNHKLNSSGGFVDVDMLKQKVATCLDGINSVAASRNSRAGLGLSQNPLAGPSQLLPSFTSNLADSAAVLTSLLPTSLVDLGTQNLSLSRAMTQMPSLMNRDIPVGAFASMQPIPLARDSSLPARDELPSASISSTLDRHDERTESSDNDSSNDPRFNQYQAEQWGKYFEDLCAYRKQAGNCFVPQTYPPNQSLARWVKVRSVSLRTVYRLAPFLNFHFS